MKRALLHWAASLLLSLACGVFGLAFIRHEHFMILVPLTPTGRVRIDSVANHKTFGLYVFRSLDLMSRSADDSNELMRKQRTADHQCLGFHYYCGPLLVTGAAAPADPTSTARAIKWGDFVVGAGMPPALMIALLLAFPAVHFWRCARRLRQVRPGECPACGYDLRATPNRCPECGRKVNAAAHSQAL
jgi:hypothetical protein